VFDEVYILFSFNIIPKINFTSCRPCYGTWEFWAQESFFWSSFI